MCFYGYYEVLEKKELCGEIDTAVKGQRTEQFDVNSVFLCHLNLQNAPLLLKRFRNERVRTSLTIGYPLKLHSCLDVLPNTNLI